MSERIFHVISNTHWDREWRFPFQRNRQMLVEMIDKVLEILESEPEYRAFHLDSQSIVLDDYIEIRPDKRELITRLVQEKRLLIGPWYILPDEFHVGGENLVRNLLLGHKKCIEFGGVSKTGYSPFSWGQISQLPQIYRQFGIDVIMFYRGVNSLDSNKAEFLWEGADGTKAITSRFSTMPRYNFYFYIYRPAVHDEGFYDVEYKWSRGGTAFHFADSKMHEEDYSIIEPLDKYFKQNIETSVKSIIENQANDFTTPNVIWMEGHDSSGPNIKTVEIIRDIKKLQPRVNVVHSTLEEYTKVLRDSVDLKSLALVKGERRSAQFDNRSGNLYGYITSARMYLKQKNFEAETWLQRYAEVSNSFAGMLELNLNDKYLDIAWNYLIQNSAHDSIGGCSLDEIHEDMMSRYKQIIEISRGLFDRACKHISKQIDLSYAGENSINLIMMNNTQYDRSGVFEAFVDVPAEFDLGAIKLIDFAGNEITFELIDSSLKEPVLEQMIDRPMFFKMQSYHLYIKDILIPSFGITALQVMPVQKEEIIPKESNLVRKRKGVYILENENLFVSVNKNGTLYVKEKSTGKEFDKVGYFFDEGEAGHAWVHKSVDPIVDTLRSEPKIKIIENGYLSAKIKISHKLKIYKTLDAREEKKGKKTKLNVSLIVSLKKDSKIIEFKIEVDNKAESHRLRFMIPTVSDANSSFAEGQFDVVERQIKHIDSQDWIEQPMYDYPMYHFVDVANKEIGAALIVQGLTEYEVKDDENRTLAITLLRGFKYIISPSSVQDYSYQKGSQCLGKHSYNLALYLHEGNWEKGKVYEEAVKFNTPVSLFQSGKTLGEIKPGTSFLEIENNKLVFDCLKKAESNVPNQFVLRLHNPTSKKIKSKIKFFRDIKSAKLVSLEEIKTANLKVTGNQFIVEAGGKKIISVLIEL